jgi:tRNA-Thr(GGU) m(6)t(6)A37 methyltransferase TsaA
LFVDMNLSRSLLRGLVPVHVLHHAEAGDVHGAWMAAELARHGYSISPGTLYPLLHRMEQDGLLTSRAVVADGRARRSYRATATGRRILGDLRPLVAELAEELGSVDAAPRIGLRQIGIVESGLTDPSTAPRQADEGAPAATIVVDDELVAALAGIAVGDDLVVITWLDRARRDTLAVQPRGDRRRRPRGVFATRSPDRPNPLGLHQVEVLAIDGPRLEVSGIEAVDGTPVVDIKPVLGPPGER